MGTCPQRLIRNKKTRVAYLKLMVKHQRAYVMMLDSVGDLLLEGEVEAWRGFGKKGS